MQGRSIGRDLITGLRQKAFHRRAERRIVIDNMHARLHRSISPKRKMSGKRCKCNLGMASTFYNVSQVVSPITPPYCGPQQEDKVGIRKEKRAGSIGGASGAVLTRRRSQARNSSLSSRSAAFKPALKNRSRCAPSSCAQPSWFRTDRCAACRAPLKSALSKK